MLGSLIDLRLMDDPDDKILRTDFKNSQLA